MEIVTEFVFVIICVAISAFALMLSVSAFSTSGWNCADGVGVLKLISKIAFICVSASAGVLCISLGGAGGVDNL